MALPEAAGERRQLELPLTGGEEAAQMWHAMRGVASLAGRVPHGESEWPHGPGAAPPTLAAAAPL